MPELFTVLPPDVALARLWAQGWRALPVEHVALLDAFGRVLAEPVRAQESLPAFARSTMDGYAVRAQDTYGASENLPAYLDVVGEAPMGRAPEHAVGVGQALVIHTGGMVPPGADAVVMIERTQVARPGEIEVLRAVAPGENVLAAGEDVRPGDALFARGQVLREQDLGGLAALGIARVPVGARPRVALLATGDEVVVAEAMPAPGQVRDVNTYTLAGVVRRAGGVPVACGIAPDRLDALMAQARAALAQADVLVLSAGSSVSVRDMTAEVLAGLGAPGVLVHGVSVRPGKPTILGVCDGKPVFGLPGNPVSALVVAQLFLAPTLWRMQGAVPPAARVVRARLTHNLASAPGRADYVPARVFEREGAWWAEPVFGKSNLIFTLVRADGLIEIPLDAGGLAAGEWVEVRGF